MSTSSNLRLVQSKEDKAKLKLINTPLNLLKRKSFTKWLEVLRLKQTNNSNLNY